MSQSRVVEHLDSPGPVQRRVVDLESGDHLLALHAIGSPSKSFQGLEEAFAFPCEDPFLGDVEACDATVVVGLGDRSCAGKDPGCQVERVILVGREMKGHVRRLAREIQKDVVLLGVHECPEHATLGARGN